MSHAPTGPMSLHSLFCASMCFISFLFSLIGKLNSPIISTLSPKNTCSSTMSLSTSNTEPLRNEMFTSSLLEKLEHSAFLRGEDKALQDAVTSAATLNERRRQQRDEISDEPPLKRRRSDEYAPKRRLYQRRNSQTAYMLFASVAAASFDAESLLSSMAEESVEDDSSKRQA